MDQKTGRQADVQSAAGYLIRNLGRGRVQLIGGLLLAVAVPYYMRLDLTFMGRTTQPTQVNSMLATAIAVIIGYFLFRQLTRYPGIISTSYIFPTFLFSFGLMLVIFFFFRIEYSRLFFLASFAVSQIWFHIAHIASKRAKRLILDVVPFGDARSVIDISGVDWVVLGKQHPVFQSREGLVADLRADLSEQWQSWITERAIRGVPVYHYKQIKETLTGRVEIEHLSENTLGSLLPDIVYLKFKHWADVAGVILALPVLLPLFGLISVLILIDDGGPILFRQQRMGFKGKTFELLKFRTMKHGEPQIEDAVEAAMTADGDKRITRFGKLLRKARLDELPQIINILRGEMSWIGPRPEAVPLSLFYEGKLPFYRYRHIVRPGITGWAQVNQGHVAAVDQVLDKLHYDFYYIKYFSVWLDMLIVLRTFRVILTGSGAK